MHVALDGRQDHCALGSGPSLLFHKRLVKSHRGLHRLGRLQDERKLHLPAAKQIADDFHSFEQNIIDDVERGIFSERGPQLIFQTNLFAVYDMVLQPLFYCFTFAGFFDALGFDVLEKRGELRQRIVGTDVAIELTPVIDQVAGDLQFLFTDPIQGLNLAGIHNRRIQTSFNGVVQKD